METGGYVYILTNENRTVLYVGVTSDINVRIQQHREKKFPGSFTAKYNVHQLVYFEKFLYIVEAIAREKQLKAGSRKMKENLISKINPMWNDLFETLDE